VFTGIVESTGTVESLSAKGRATRRIVIATALPLGTIPLGGSVAVDGVCLTLVARRGRRFEADLGPETLARTTLGRRRPGDRVHLERPLRVGDPLGGHLVAGHVDGVGRVLATRAEGEALLLEVLAPAELSIYVVPKGSITIDGVSLTVNQVNGARFKVTLIPHTLAVTKLGGLRAGDEVNLEADLMAKHVGRMLLAWGRGPRTRGKRRPKETESTRP
jgi:riboflavin synthase